MKKQTKPIGRFASIRKMEGGGYPDPAEQTKASWLQMNGNTLATGASFASAGINAIDPQDKYGVQSNVGALGSGALSGAATGFKTAGVIGAGIGAVVGGVTGLLGNKKKQREKNEAIAKNTTAQMAQTEAMGEANIAGDPSLKYGRMTASYYRFGGTMKGTLPAGPRLVKPIAAVQSKPRLMPNIAEVPGRQISRLKNGGSVPEYSLQKFKRFKPIKMAKGGSIHINPANKGKFNATKAATGKSTEELTHSSNSVTKKRAVFAQNSAKWNHKANGGTIEPLSSEDIKVNGPSHNAGGVKFPSKGVELEGGETVNDGFVFSKKLGFAKPAEKIARALGKAEARPDSPINTSTVSALKRKTELLKGQQEATKAAMGIPNEFEQKAMGGPLDVAKPRSLKLPTTPIDFNKLRFPTPIQDDDFITKNATTFGAANGTAVLPGGGTITNLRASSDKMNGTSNTFYSARNQARGKAIPTQHTSGYFADGGTINEQPPVKKLKQVNIVGKRPLVVHDKNDPRLKAYNDSSTVYNENNNMRNKMIKSGLFKPKSEITKDWVDAAQGKARVISIGDPTGPLIKHKDGTMDIAGDIDPKAPQAKFHIIPNIRPQNTEVFTRKEAEGTWNLGSPKWVGESIDNYKQPTQPVVYKPYLRKQFIKTTAPVGNPGLTIDGQVTNRTLSFPSSTQSLRSPAILPSDKAAGYSNSFYSANGQQRGKSMPTQPRTSFKFGGSMKKMDDGGRVKFPLPSLNPDATMPNIPELNISDSQVPVFPMPIIPPGITPQLGSNSKGKFNVDKTLADIADKASPFLSNFVNATQKLPLPPTPILTPEITPSLVDYSASRAEAVRATRSADAMAARNLNSGAAISATKAANLSQQQRSVGQINEAEGATNAGIRNQVKAQNSQIKAGNNALQNNYNNELVSRTIKGQQLKSQNFANIEEKIQGMSRDKKLFDLEDQKAMLGWLQNNDSGAGYDAVRTIFAKHLSPESLKQMDDQIAKQRKERGEDRAETVKMGKLQLDYLKRKGVTPNNPYDLVGNGVSVVNSAKEEQADSKTRIKKKE